MKKNFLFISCDEAYQICDRSQYGEATLWDRFKLNLRYIWCDLTRAYVNKNRKLTQAIKASNIHSLHQSERAILAERFHQHLKNGV